MSQSFQTEFDVIVIGGGINGLTAAAYRTQRRKITNGLQGQS